MESVNGKKEQTVELTIDGITHDSSLINKYKGNENHGLNWQKIDGRFKREVYQFPSNTSFQQFLLSQWDY